MSQQSFQQGVRSRQSTQSATDEWVRKQNAILKANQPGKEGVTYTTVPGAEIAKLFPNIDKKTINPNKLFQVSSTGNVTSSAMNQSEPKDVDQATEGEDKLYFNVKNFDKAKKDWTFTTQLTDKGERIESRTEGIMPKLFAKDEKTDKYIVQGEVFDKLRNQSRSIMDPRASGDMKWIENINSEVASGSAGDTGYNNLFNLSGGNVAPMEKILDRVTFDQETQSLQYVPSQKDIAQSGVLLNNIIKFSSKGVKSAEIDSRTDFRKWYRTQADLVAEHGQFHTLGLPQDISLFTIKADEDGFFQVVPNQAVPGIDAYLEKNKNYLDDVKGVNMVLMEQQSNIQSVNPELFRRMLKTNKSMSGSTPTDYTDEARTKLESGNFQLNLGD